MEPILLKHHGVKGMKWGVVKNKTSNAKSAVKTRVKEEIKSAKRELGWKKQLKNIDDMDLKTVRETAQRVQNENKMKNLINDRKASNIKDHKKKSELKKQYRNREKLSDKDLQDVVQKMEWQQMLMRESRNASKIYRDKGKEMVDQVGALSSTVKPFVDHGKNIIDALL